MLGEGVPVPTGERTVVVVGRQPRAQGEERRAADGLARREVGVERVERLQVPPQIDQRADADRDAWNGATDSGARGSMRWAGPPVLNPAVS
ncbi:MAG: hypothetical protein ACI8PZ_003081 [Myxococcota bacterium]|jgi:hypothetical protein